MPDEILLKEAAYAVWQTVQGAGQGGIELSEAVSRTGIDQAQVSAAATEAVANGYFQITERQRDELIVSEGARQLYDAGLPELRAEKKLREAGGEMEMADFVAWAKSENVAVNDV